jgi:Leucine-rich repeat (LRR) protein
MTKEETAPENKLAPSVNSIGKPLPEFISAFECKGLSVVNVVAFQPENETAKEEGNECNMPVQPAMECGLVFNDAAGVFEPHETEGETLPVAPEAALQSEAAVQSALVPQPPPAPELTNHATLRPVPVPEPGAYTEGPGEEYARLDKIHFSSVGRGATGNTPSHGFSRAEPIHPRQALEDPVATLVNDLEAADPVQGRTVDEIKVETPDQKTKWIIAALTFACVAVVAAGTGVALRANDSDEVVATEPTASLSGNDTLQPTPEVLSPEEYLWQLLPDYSQEAIHENSDSPQARALEWLLQDPNLASYREERLLQRFALATFYHSTHGDGWDNSADWLSHDVHECQWYMAPPVSHLEPNYESLNATGEPCEGGDIYQHLRFFNQGLVGTLPPELGLLTSLVIVDFSDNALRGTLPTQIGLLKQVDTFFCFRSGLEGTIPTEIGMMESLKALRLDTNHLSGGIPSQIGFLGQLTQLWGFDNILSSSLPTELGNLPSTMRRFEMFGNALTGTIPSELGLLKELGELTLDYNMLTGPIPSTLGQIDFQLGLLFLQGNELTGTIPTELGQLAAELYRLYLFSNQLSGTIPTELGDLTGMEILLLHDNRLQGPIPSTIGNMKQLWALYLNCNQQTGLVPPEWFDALPLRQDFGLDRNMFTGTIPSTLGGLSDLHYLWLPNNALSSTLPSELSQLQQLSAFSVAGNSRLSGTIPEALAVLATNGSLGFFNVSGTAITGTVPSDLCALDSGSFGFDCGEKLCGCYCACMLSP